VNDVNDHHQWPDALESLVETLDHLDRVVVLAETPSTQDALLRLDPEPGTVLVAAAQTGGRGRLGRHWSDHPGAGTAVSIAVATDTPPVLCARAAVALARAYAPLVGRRHARIGIKWPNDLVLIDPRPRKLAGVLVEQQGARAIVGIGVNVSDRPWPEELAGQGGSLQDAGIELTRLEAMTALLRAWDEAVGMSLDSLREQFGAHDLLRGRQAVFDERGTLHEGTVEVVDPFGGILLRTPAGPILLEPDTAKLHAWEPLSD